LIAVQEGGRRPRWSQPYPRDEQSEAVAIAYLGYILRGVEPTA